MVMQEILAEFELNQSLASVPDLLDPRLLDSLCTDAPKTRSAKEVSRVEVCLPLSLSYASTPSVLFYPTF
jgi:hypothetical protein